MAVLTIGDQFPAYELTGVVPGKLADIEATKPEDLSLIHISEPTRPY